MKSFKDINKKETDLEEACWVGYKKVGMKKKGDRMVPDCVKEEVVNEVYGKDWTYNESVADFYKGKLSDTQLINLKNLWKNKRASDITPSVKSYVQGLDQFTKMDIKKANIKHLSNLIDSVQKEEVDFITPLQDQIEIIEMNSVVRKTDLKEFSSDQIERLAKAYSMMKDRTISVDNAKKLVKMMDGVPVNSLNALRKKRIPFLSGLAMTRMIKLKMPITETYTVQITKKDGSKMSLGRYNTSAEAQRYVDQYGAGAKIVKEDLNKEEVKESVDDIRKNPNWKLQPGGGMYPRYKHPKHGNINIDRYGGWQHAVNGKVVAFFSPSYPDNKFSNTGATSMDLSDYMKLKKINEDLNKDDKKTIEPIIKQLQKSVTAHGKQAKQLKKDIADEKDLEEKTGLQRMGEMMKKLATVAGYKRPSSNDGYQAIYDYKNGKGKYQGKGKKTFKQVQDWIERNGYHFPMFMLKSVLGEEVEIQEADLSKSQITKVHKQADDLPKKDFMKRYGKDGDAVRYATATNMVKKKLGIGEDNKLITKGELKMNESYKLKLNSAMEHYKIASLAELKDEDQKAFFSYVDGLNEEVSLEEKDVPAGSHKMPDGTIMKDKDHKKEETVDEKLSSQDLAKVKKDMHVVIKGSDYLVYKVRGNEVEVTDAEDRKTTYSINDITSIKGLRDNPFESMREEDAYDNDRFIIKNGKATVDNSNTADNKDHVHAPDAKIALQLHKQGKKVYKEELSSAQKKLPAGLQKAIKDKEAKEDLVGGQKKLDKDKDGDLDAKDFAALRKDKTEDHDCDKTHPNESHKEYTTNKVAKEYMNMSASKNKMKTESHGKYLQTKPGSLEEAVLKARGLIK